MNLIKSKNQNKSVDTEPQQPNSTTSPIQRAFTIGVTTIIIVGFALVMIRMGKVMAKDLGEIPI